MFASFANLPELPCSSTGEVLHSEGKLLALAIFLSTQIVLCKF
jgi:hypothetical protein